MHVIQLLASDLFEIRLEGREAARHAVYPDWTANDRFGVVIDEPFGGLGASHLIQLASAMFYDAKPSRRSDRKVYPEIYALHYGHGFGAHAPFDFWPARREVILEKDPRVLLDAINDRAITRLAIPDRPRREIEHRPKEEDAALDRIVSAFVYSATGRVNAPNFSIRGTDARTEYNPKQVLKLARTPPRKPAASRIPAASIKETDTSYHEWIEERRADVSSDDIERAQSNREALRDDRGLSTESYRFVDVAEALQRL